MFDNNYTIVHFANSDIKQVIHFIIQSLPDKTIIYYFSENDTTQTTMANGVNVNLNYQIRFIDFLMDNQKSIIIIIKKKSIFLMELLKLYFPMGMKKLILKMEFIKKLIISRNKKQ